MRAAPLTTAVIPYVPMSGLRPHLARVQWEGGYSSPTEGESLTSWWARDLAQLREMRTARVATAECRSEKWSGAAEALEVHRGESFAVR